MNKSALALLMGVISAAKYTSNDGGPTWSINYDSGNQDYKFGADMSIGTDLWLAFSTDCETNSCDMVQFLTTGAGAIKDSYGTLTTPRADFINDYKSPSVSKSSDGNSMTFEATRGAAPSDSIGKDLAFDCGKEYEFTWVIKPSGDSGTWKMKLNDDCSVYEEASASNDNSSNDNETAGATFLAATSIAVVTVMASLF